MNTFLKKPSENLNSLNKIVPKLISQFADDPESTMLQVGTMLQALDDDKVPYSIEKDEFNEGIEKFVSLRIQALLTSIID